MRARSILFLFAFFCFKHIVAQVELDKSKKYIIAGVGFYNVENLYDTLNDPITSDEEFTPEGLYRWNTTRYWTKIEHISDVISEMASDVTPDGLAMMGLCEIENKTVLKDLARSKKLKSRNYQIVHYDGPDARGVDVAFLYNPKYFKLTKALTYHVTLITDSAHKTRDQLLVTGNFNGDPMAVIVNHWPSRRGGELLSKANRIVAAKMSRHIADSITKVSPQTKILIMGDLNDDPTSESVKKNIKTYGDLSRTRDDEFFNPMESLYKKGIGTLAWEDAWNLFDQILINKSCLPTDFKTFQYYNVRVFNKPYLRSDHGNFKGYPFRTYGGSTYNGGYSDHFPVYILMVKEIK